MPEPAESDQASAVLFGQGDFPEELNRLNWGAMFMGGIWALVHGVWRWLIAFIVLRILAIFVFLPFSNGELANSATWGLISSVLSEIIYWVILGVFALNANRLAWQRTGRLMASGRHEPSALSPSIESFSKAQRTWFLVGLALTVFQYANGYRTMMSQWPDRQVSALAGFACAGLVVGAFYLIDRRRANTLARSS